MSATPADTAFGSRSVLFRARLHHLQRPEACVTFPSPGLPLPRPEESALVLPGRGPGWVTLRLTPPNLLRRLW